MLRAILAIALLATALSGCVDEYGNPIEWTAPEQGNATVTVPAPVANGTPAATPPEPPAKGAPIVTSIATARFTAPGPVALASATDGQVSMLLEASADGIHCIADSDIDLWAAPAGYVVDDVWSRCSLAADNATFTSAHGGLEALPLMLDVPVDHFSWSYEIGRTLRNNTGTSDQELLTGTEDLLAAPAATLIESPDPWTEACDTQWDSEDYPDGVLTLTWTAHAVRGLPSLSVDPAGQRVIEAKTSHGNATYDNATGIYSITGDWDTETVTMSLTIDFEGEGDTIYLIPGCMGLGIMADHVDIEAVATAQGIAAGWHDVIDDFTTVDVFVMVI